MCGILKPPVQNDDAPQPTRRPRKTVVQLQVCHHPVFQSQLGHCEFCYGDEFVVHWRELKQDVLTCGRPPPVSSSPSSDCFRFNLKCQIKVWMFPRGYRSTSSNTCSAKGAVFQELLPLFVRHCVEIAIVLSPRQR